ncbi:MAG: 1-phosphofructokinase, partial [Anaerolineales bacterium]|nr:1-phosphofructokinase [Anaerolineales bacterium]
MIYTLTLNPAVDRELTVPAIEFDTVLRACDWRVDFGGKGFNVSRMLKSLGTTSTALGFTGGRAGELLRNGLESLGIQTDFVWVTGETRTNVSIVDEGNGRYIKVNEPGPTISIEDQNNLLAKIRQLAQSDDWWVLAGSLPPGVPAEFYADIIAILHEAGAQAILDTSGTALEHGCGARPFLAKPNDVEAGQLTDLPVQNRTQIAAAAQAVQAAGVRNVVISLGKDGAILANGEQIVIAASPTIEERNPIGAGDSMVGGLVWGLSQGQDVAEALRWGIACGAATASMSGTAVGTK